MGIFSIGMGRSEFMSKLDANKVTQSTNKKIENFWKTDKDGQITNEIELAMLDSWASGSDKVKMPEGKKELKIPTYLAQKTQLSDESYYSESNKKQKPIRYELPKSAEILEIYKNRSDETKVRWSFNDSLLVDTLVDNDGDGYADSRSYLSYGEYTNFQYKDSDLSGTLSLASKNITEDEANKRVNTILSSRNEKLSVVKDTDINKHFSKSVLQTEQDVEEYISKLREEYLRQIKNGKQIKF